MHATRRGGDARRQRVLSLNGVHFRRSSTLGGSSPRARKRSTMPLVTSSISTMLHRHPLSNMLHHPDNLVIKQGDVTECRFVQRYRWNDAHNIIPLARRVVGAQHCTSAAQRSRGESEAIRALQKGSASRPFSSSSLTDQLTRTHHVGRAQL